MDLETTITLNIFLLLLFGTICFSLYVRLKKSIYTREKFAFAGLAAGSSLTVFLLASIYAQEPPWLVVIGLIKQLFLGEIYQPRQSLTIEQNILSILVVGGFWWLIIYMHRNWNGAQSTAHYEQQQKQQSPNLIKDSWLLLNPKSNQELLRIYNPENQYRHTALEGAEESFIWHEQALDLLQLSNNNYDFPEDGWHERERCWIGTHNGTGDTVVLACYENQADEINLQELVQYTEKVRQHKKHDGNGLEFIFALKEGDIDEKTKINGQPLRTVSESRLLDNLVNFNNYFRQLTQRVEQEPLTGSDLTLKQVYTVAGFKLEKDGMPQADLETFLNTWLEDSGRRQIALLGEYGQGKSTTSLMLSYHLMQRFQRNSRTARIPILLELRGKSPRTLREDELLSTWSGRYGIDTRALIKLLVAGRLLLIFEGFDEVDLAGDADARIEHFKIMWGLCYPKAKILVTGRPNYFLDDVERKTALGIQEVSLERPYCQAISLVPFDFKKIERSLRHFDDDTRDGILDLAAVNNRFYDIVSRPSMLHVVSILWKTENLAQYGEHINSALVMDLFIRHTLERQGSKGQQYDSAPIASGKAKPKFMALNSHERAYFMAGIATYMLIHQLPNQITGRQLEEVTRLLLEIMPELVSQQADAQSGEPRKPLRQRYDFTKPENIQTILTDVRTCGLLVPDLIRSGSFKFGHKSFMEFLAGKVFAQWSLRKELNNVEEKSVCSLVNKLELEMLHVVRQQEVMAFAVEWIAEKAKDHNEAAQVIFNLLFRQCNFLFKFVGSIFKYSMRFLAHTKNSSFLSRLSYFHRKNIVFMLNISNTHKRLILSIHETSFITVGSVLVISRLFLDQKTFFNLIPSFFIEFILIVGLFYVMFFLEFYSRLMIGYRKQEDNKFWIKFRVWYAICAAANLKRSAMANVIGEKSLQLLEEVADKEDTPWTIAESLEMLTWEEDDN